MWNQLLKLWWGVLGYLIPKGSSIFPLNKPIHLPHTSFKIRMPYPGRRKHKRTGACQTRPRGKGWPTEGWGNQPASNTRTKKKYACIESLKVQSSFLDNDPMTFQFKSSPNNCRPNFKNFARKAWAPVFSNGCSIISMVIVVVFCSWLQLAAVRSWFEGSVDWFASVKVRKTQ